MKKHTLMLAGIVAGIVLVAAAAFIIGGGADENGDSGERGSVITYTNDGFSPPVLRVESGTAVTVRNESSRDLELSSDQHPTHNENAELNTPVIAPGESTEVTLTNPGTWGYHDHLNPGEVGGIIVE
jgi:plastocyanin